MVGCRIKSMSFMRCLLAALCLILLSAAGGFASEPAGKVEAADGVVWAMRDGKRVELSKNSDVFEFDVLCTDKSGSAAVRFKDDTVLEIKANSKIDVKEVVFTDSRNRFNVGVVNGTAKVITGLIVKKNPKGFKVTTPKSTIGIRGTELTVAVDAATGVETVKVNDISDGHTVDVSYNEIGERRSLLAAGASSTIDERNVVDSDGDVSDTTGLDGAGAAAGQETNTTRPDAKDNRPEPQSSPGASGSPGSAHDACETDNSSPPR